LTGSQQELVAQMIEVANVEDAVAVGILKEAKWYVFINKEAFRNMDQAMELFFTDAEKYIKKYSKPKPKLPVLPPADKPSEYDAIFKNYAGKLSY
jgi:hypothetical protein